MTDDGFMLDRWGAGGATSEATTAFVKTAHAELGLETCMHLTCTNMPVSMVDAALKVRISSLLICSIKTCCADLEKMRNRKPTILDVVTFWHFEEIPLEVRRSGLLLKADSIMPSISSGISARTMEITSILE